MSISYVLRTCKPDFTSRNNFKWPSRGIVECPDFEATQECGHGLHGLLDGCGEGTLVAWGRLAQWLLVAVPTESIIDLGDHVKFPRGEVLFSSQNRLAVIAELERLNPETLYKPVVGASRTDLKHGAHVLVGDCGTAMTGDRGTAMVGKWGKAKAGLDGNLVFRYYGDLKTFHVDGEKVKPNTLYRLDFKDNLNLEEIS